MCGKFALHLRLSASTILSLANSSFPVHKRPPEKICVALGGPCSSTALPHLLRFCWSTLLHMHTASAEQSPPIHPHPTSSHSTHSTLPHLTPHTHPPTHSFAPPHPRHALTPIVPRGPPPIVIIMAMGSPPITTIMAMGRRPVAMIMVMDGTPIAPIMAMGGASLP